MCIRDRIDTIHNKDEMVIQNLWKDTPKLVSPNELNLDECPPLRGYSEGSIKPNEPLHALNFDGYTGYDICDVKDCFCKDDESRDVNEKDGTNSPTDTETPCTG